MLREQCQKYVIQSSPSAHQNCNHQEKYFQTVSPLSLQPLVSSANNVCVCVCVRAHTLKYNTTEPDPCQMLLSTLLLFHKNRSLSS